MIHRHLYKHVGDIENKHRDVRYQDWACVKIGCHKTRRCYFYNSPTNRLPGGIPGSVEEDRVFGASDC